ncbi:MAG: D-galactosyl-beta-1-4-L-rhamnose phosphorylase, partial [Spirochaetes bacterium]|nr:D-galactosyl-beta-1-4-L-rhamnose phosphorylase [Spirochaetota bacterium]
MWDDAFSRGSFTLPGEAGYEKLTAALAEMWGADTIRDSDGTRLSDAILSSGYDIYSTLCLVRADNAWARANRDKLQQNFLMSRPVVAQGPTVRIDLLDGYFRDQFVVDADDDPREFWQVFDRTTGREVPVSNWSLDATSGTVTISHATPWHRYTVNFLVWRIWEEISMYNHITNDWGDRERLMSVEPRHPETKTHLLEVLERWLEDRPAT